MSSKVSAPTTFASQELPSQGGQPPPSRKNTHYGRSHRPPPAPPASLLLLRPTRPHGQGGGNANKTMMARQKHMEKMGKAGNSSGGASGRLARAHNPDAAAAAQAKREMVRRNSRHRADAPCVILPLRLAARHGLASHCPARSGRS